MLVSLSTVTLDHSAPHTRSTTQAGQARGGEAVLLLPLLLLPSLFSFERGLSVAPTHVPLVFSWTISCSFFSALVSAFTAATKRAKKADKHRVAAVLLGSFAWTTIATTPHGCCCCKEQGCGEHEHDCGGGARSTTRVFKAVVPSRPEMSLSLNAWRPLDFRLCSVLFQNFVHDGHGVNHGRSI
jgi:hypothetical protein